MLRLFDDAHDLVHAVGDAVGDAGVVPPVHTTPLSAKLPGTGLDALFQVPPKPKFVVTPVPRAAFHAALVTVTSDPDWLTVPFHSCVTV